MRPTTSRSPGRRAGALGVAAAIIIIGIGHAARGGEPAEILGPGDVVTLAPETKLRVGRQVLDTKDHRHFSVRKVRGDWVWVVDRGLEGWVKAGEVVLVPLPAEGIVALAGKTRQGQALNFAAAFLSAFSHGPEDRARVESPGPRRKKVPTVGDIAVLRPKTSLHIGGQVIDPGKDRREFTIERIEGDWLWVESRDLKGWIEPEDVSFFHQWDSWDDIVLKSLETPLRVGRTALDTRRNGQKFDVKRVQGEWLWAVGDDVKGWVKKRDVVPESKALDYYTAVIQKDSRSSRARYARGLALERKDEHDRALADFDEAIRLDPTFAAAYRARAVVTMDVAFSRSDREAHLARALRDLDEAIRLDPGDAEAHYQRGVLRGYYSEIRDTDRALADLTEAIRLGPKVDAYAGRAGYWEDKHDYDRATADYDEAIRLAKQDGLQSNLLAGIYLDRSKARHERGDLDGAIADLTEIIRLDPWLFEHRIPAAYNDRGLLWWEKGQGDRALADFSKVIAGDARAEAALKAIGFDDKKVIAASYVNRSLVRMGRGEKEQALADCEELIRLKPNDNISYAVRGQVRYTFGEYELALADFRGAVRLRPKSVASLACLAWLLATCPDAKLRDGKEAVEIAKRGCDIAIGDNPVGLVGLAAARAEAGDFDGAVQSLSKAIPLLSSANAREARAMLELYRKKTPFHAPSDDRTSRSARLGLPNLRRTAD